MPIYARLALILLTAVVAGSAQNCFFSITPNTASFPAAGGNGQITVTASAGDCQRSVTSNASWITVSFGQTGTGSGTSGYTVAVNNTASQRTGTLNVAGQLFTVTQAAGTCSYQLSPASATAPSTGGTASFQVTSSCGWTAVSTATWLTASAAESTVTWTAAANTTATQRSGTITVGTATFTVTQPAGTCAVTATTTSLNFAAAGGTGTITVETRDGCARTAESTVAWMRITSGASGTGAGTVGFTVDVNTTRQSRIGSIRVQDQIVTIRQEGSTCVYLLNPRTANIPAAGGTGTFSIGTSSGCTWTATSSVPWVVIDSGTSGTANGTVTFSVGANYDASPRSAFVAVGDQTFVVSQPGAACFVEVSRQDFSLTASGGLGTVSVGTLASCTWTATTTDSWITITRGASGTGAGDVDFTVAPNGTVLIRNGTIAVGDKVIRIAQAAANCAVSIGSRAASVAQAGGSGTVAITANCAWRAVPSAEWIQITSPATGSADTTLAYSVTANNTPDERRGTITVNGQTLTITQAGQRCTVSVGTASVRLTTPPRGGAGTLDVTGAGGCAWTAASSAAWLEIQWSSVGGTGTVRYTAQPNASGAVRTASISIGDKSVVVEQAPIVVRVGAEGVLNAASFASGAVAPGEIVTIYGEGFGASSLALLQLTPDRQRITDRLANTRVLFDGQAAPMVYAIDGQLSAIVPYAVAGKETTSVEVEYAGVRSAPASLRVVSAAPAVFTVAASGRGQAAVLNQDFSVNGPANAATRSSVIQIFATGEGQTSPLGVDGKLAAVPLPVPLLPVRVFIGGVEARVTYAGGAPGLVAGLIQINAEVPGSLQPGPETPLVIRVGDAGSPAGPTIAIR